MTGINLAAKLATFNEYFQPRTIGQFNGHELRVVKAKGEFVWHKHDDTDDFFLVLKGRITIQLRGGNVTLGPGELFAVPAGVEHCPIAEEEAHVLLIEREGRRTPAIHARLRRAGSPDVQFTRGGRDLSYADSALPGRPENVDCMGSAFPGKRAADRPLRATDRPWWKAGELNAPRTWS
jgi:mannose-6-phosphate isomerase-like protein (cupin superfamily)